ncbi:alpha/beta hydrolase family protein [Luteimonas aquatica]|uniref:alpha/beta hydrolase family protein n=1 Tax=Luteimonas aquatica TaxID=450364 RepID=UPI001F5A185F|nr:prolyl oligopeptidase family serine peptidase [Luteimonas aquatica]
MIALPKIRLPKIRLPKFFGARAALALMVCALAAPAAWAERAEDAALRAAVSAERARATAPRFDRVAFLGKPRLLGIWLSPDGRRIAYLRESGRNRGLWLLPAGGGTARRLLLDTDATRVAFTRDSRWLLLESPRQLSALAVAGQPGSGAIAKLGGRWPRRFMGADPVMPAAAIVLESPPRVSRKPRQWRLYRVRVDGTQTLLHASARQLVDFAFDDDGRLAFVSQAERDKYVIYRLDRPATSDAHGARRARPREAMRCVDLQRCSLLAATDRGRGLLLGTDAGSGFHRLAHLDADGRLRTLHADPRGEADLDEVVLDPATREPLIAGYRSTVATNYGLTAQARGHVDAIERRYPRRNLRIEVGAGPGAHWLVHERGGEIKGERLHVYDPATRRFRDPIDEAGFQSRGKPVAPLPASAMARKIAFSYPASDGMRLHGFLLVPPGVDAARAPLIAFVHGGPFNLFRPEFSSTSQFLANRGYVVFESNFRGSTGHGRAYVQAARGDFGNGRVQQDIVEGVRYLLAQGIGDARRVGIVGASFGGYSALQGVTFQPELFKVGIAAVPPADFGWVLRWYARSLDALSPGILFPETLRLLSLDPFDVAIAERLRAQSPIANAARLRRPLLLLAGGDDERVPVRSVTHYAAQLRALDKDLTLFIDARARHQLEDPRTREAYLYLMERTLHRALGGPAPAPPDKALRDQLRRDVLIDGGAAAGTSGAAR